MPLHNTGYQHWEGTRLGIWYRRWIIASNGLRGALQNKWLRRLLVLCWTGAMAQVAVLFLVGQLLVTDSLVTRSLDNLNPQAKAVLKGLTAWLELHPEVSVRVTENFLFYQFSRILFPISMLVLALAIPHLITRDLGSKAIVIYSSKAVNRMDYLLGKFGTAVGLMSATWLGPVLFAWFLGNMLAPKWHFFWHSRLALIHSVLFIGISMVVLAVIAMGVSAISKREKVPVSLWLGFWLVGRFLATLTTVRRAHTMDEGGPPEWLQNLSLTFNLEQVQAGLFRLVGDLKLAQDNVPFLAQFTQGIPRHVLKALEHPDLLGAAVGLTVMVALAVAIQNWRVRPE